MSELNYPEIKSEESSESNEDSPEDGSRFSKMENASEQENEGSSLIRLTNLVRHQYLNYVQKLLKINYNTWCGENGFLAKNDSDNWIKYCAQVYEEKAIKSCMIVNLYRKSMLKIIAEIRRETSYGKLVSKLKGIHDENRKYRKKNQVDVEVQTDEQIEFNKKYEGNLNLIGIHEIRNECLSLQEKIQYFQQKLDEREKIIKEITENSNEGKNKNEKNQLPGSNLSKFNNNVNHKKHKQSHISHYHHHSSKIRKCNSIHTEQIQRTISMSSLEDKLVEFEKPKNPTAQSNSIDFDDELAKELEDLLGEKKNPEDEIFGDNTYDLQVEKILQEIENSDLQKLQNNNKKDSSLQLSPVIAFNDNTKENYDKLKDLRDSIWPCELHMRVQKLRQILYELSEKGIRHYEMIKHRFIELFGEDSEDEFAPYSPTIETNEILIESCKKRVAPIIVKYLMIPMTDGLIGNRFLFKKLAKKLANLIISQNLYPGESHIKQIIEDLFCHKKAINSIEDLKDIFN